MKKSRLSYDEWKCIISKDIFGKIVNSELFNGYQFYHRMIGIV